MQKTQWIAALGCSLMLASAQTASQNAYRGQSWVGLLVSAGCDKGTARSGERSTATRESDLTTSGRITTPAVDAAGTRGSSTASDTGTKSSAEKQTAPETGNVLEKSKSTVDSGWAPAHKQARSLGASCSLSANTTQFALLLPDGSRLQFDDLANQQIAKQVSLPAPGAKDHKVVLRVSIQGKLQNGKIALDSIQM